MPWLLMTMCQVQAVISVILFMGVWPWPGATYELIGEASSYIEFWSSGHAPLLLIASATMSYICFATVKGINWSRWANLLCWSAAIIFFNYGTMTGLMIGGIFIFGLWCYLFKSAGVNGYYHGLGEENQQGQAS